MTEYFTFDLVKDGTVHGQIKLACTAEPMGKVEIQVLEGPSQGEFFIARDFFDALAGLRKALEKEHLRPACLGACLFVYPSGMSRDMGHGRQAYYLETLRPATKDDLVDIFDPLPDHVSLGDLASVPAQEAFRKSLLSV